jgi:hypothetical protein
VVWTSPVSVWSVSSLTVLESAMRGADARGGPRDEDRLSMSVRPPEPPRNSSRGEAAVKTVGSCGTPRGRDVSRQGLEERRNVGRGRRMQAFAHDET